MPEIPRDQRPQWTHIDGPEFVSQRLLIARLLDTSHKKAKRLEQNAKRSAAMQPRGMRDLNARREVQAARAAAQETALLEGLDSFLAYVADELHDRYGIDCMITDATPVTMTDTTDKT